ncbi:hypothetical protein C5C99_13950, partial [Rathayibacter sp. AY1C4]
MLSSLPPSWPAPSIWAAAVADPQRKPAGQSRTASRSARATCSERLGVAVDHYHRMPADVRL